MKKNKTSLVFLVDRSGSMAKIANDMIDGFNEFINKQKETPGECDVSFYQFDDIYETVYERVKLNEIKELTNDTYKPRNMTALYDAMGDTIINYGKYLSSLSEDERPERLLIVTITDGENNASNKFTLDQVRNLVIQQTKDYSWDFVFLGSNIDSWEKGGNLGVASSSTLQFANSSGSVQNAFLSLTNNTRGYRSTVEKSNFSFNKADYEDQDQFLDKDMKAKNKVAIDAASK